MERYDADREPVAAEWLALDEEQRKTLVLRHHRGRVERVLHGADYNREIHAMMHVIIENEIASGEPAITGQTIARLCADGLRRHAALHAVIELLIRALAQEWSYTPEGWAQRCAALTAGDWLGMQMRRDLGKPE